MTQKSTIGIVSDTEELLDLLNQHILSDDIEYIGVKCPESQAVACAVLIDNRSDQSLSLKALHKTEAVTLIKPFNISRLVSEVYALLEQVRKQPLSKEAIILDKIASNVTVEDKVFTLTEKECLLLEALFQAYPKPVEQKWLLKHVWQYQEEVDSQTLQTHIYRLRQKLGKYAGCIETVEDGYVLHLS